MSPMRPLLVALALLTAIRSTPLRAECIGGGPWKRAPADDDAHLLFTGKVTRVGGLTVTFDVDRVWSGRVQRHMTLLLMPGGIETHTTASFVRGVVYFVDADDSGVRAGFSSDEVRQGTPVYRISFCSETGPISNDRVRENITNLGRGRPPRS